MRYRTHFKALFKLTATEAALVVLLVAPTLLTWWLGETSDAVLYTSASVIGLTIFMWAKSQHLRREGEIQRRRLRYTAIAAPSATPTLDDTVLSSSRIVSIAALNDLVSNPPTPALGSDLGGGIGDGGGGAAGP